MATRPYWFAFGSGSPTVTAGLSPTFIYFVNTSGATIVPPTISQIVTGSGLYLANYSATQTIAFILDGATTGLANSDRYISGVMDPYDLFGFTMTAIGDTTIALGTTNVALGITHVGQGVSILAQGVSLSAQNVSLLAFGSSLTAQGVSLFALGTTNVAIGTTLFGYGVSTIALGTTTVAGLNNLGSTLVGIGNTAIGFGISTLALGNFIGSTASSIGTTLIDPTTVFGFLMRNQEMTEGNQTYTKSTGVLDLFTRGATLLREKTITDTSTTTTKS